MTSYDGPIGADDVHTSVNSTTEARTPLQGVGQVSARKPSKCSQVSSNLSRRRRWSARAWVVVLTVALTLPSLTASAPAQAAPKDEWMGSWKQVAELPTNGQFRTATAGLGDDRRLYYVRGGAGGDIYDVDTGTWTSLPPTSRPGLSEAGVATGSDGRIYVVGGQVSNAPSAEVEAYDPAAPDAGWMPVAELSLPRANLVAVNGPDGRIYAIGGGKGAAALATVEAYDPSAPELGWFEVASMSVGRTMPVAAVGSDGRIYVVGGTGDGRSVEAYDPGDDTWTDAPRTAFAHSTWFAAAAGPDGRIYVMGGYSGGAVDTVEVFDPASARWMKVAPLRSGRYNLAATLGPDGRIYAMGGSGSGAAKAVDAYTPGERPPADWVDPVSERETRTPNATLGGITTGPDGNLWFAEPNAVGRMTPEGTFDYFDLLPGSHAGVFELAVGPDGNVWFTMQTANKIGRITPEGVITEFPLPVQTTPGPVVNRPPVETGIGPRGITAGPDDNMWFVLRTANKVGRITPLGAITLFDILLPDSRPEDIALGPDGNLWFTHTNAPNIGRITPAGSITEFPTFDVGTIDITAGPGDDLWFTMKEQRVGHISPLADDPASTYREYDLKGSDATDITTGPDGNLWLTQQADRQILRLTPSPLSVTEIPLPFAGAPHKITAGPDGHMWFTKAGPGGIGRVELDADGLRYVPPGALCVSTGQYVANYQKTGTRSCTIVSPGPITHLIISPYLNCQVFHVLDSHPQHYPAKGDGECGTFLEVEEKVYGPESVPCYYNGAKPDKKGIVQTNCIQRRVRRLRLQPGRPAGCVRCRHDRRSLHHRHHRRRRGRGHRQSAHHADRFLRDRRGPLPHRRRSHQPRQRPGRCAAVQGR